MRLKDLVDLAEPLGWAHSGTATGTALFARAGQHFEVTLGEPGKQLTRGGWKGTSEIYSLYADGKFVSHLDHLDQALRRVVQP